MAADGLRTHKRALGHAHNPELCLAASAARLSVITAGPVLGGAWLVAGTPGLVGAAIAAVLVSVLLWSSATVLAVLARRGGTALMVGVLGGFCTRLVVTAVVLASLAPMKGIDRPSLALSGIVLIAVTLGFQSWQVSRIPGYFWVTPASAADGNKRTHP